MNTHSLAALVAAAVFGVSVPTAQAHDDSDHALRADHHQRGSELRAPRLNRPVVAADSTGRVVGRVVPGGQFGAVLLRYRQDTLVVPLGPYPAGGPLASSGLDWGTSYVVYGGLNCTGQVYIPASVYALGGTRMVLTERRGNQWFLLLGSNAGSITLSPEELRSTSMGGLNCFNSAYQGPMNVFPVEEVVPLDPVGIGPFFYR